MQNTFKIYLSGHFLNTYTFFPPHSFQVSLHKQAPEQLSGWLSPEHKPIYYHPPFSPTFLHQARSVAWELDRLFSGSALCRSVHTHVSMDTHTNFNPHRTGIGLLLVRGSRNDNLFGSVGTRAKRDKEIIWPSCQKTTICSVAGLIKLNALLSIFIFLQSLHLGKVLYNVFKISA